MKYPQTLESLSIRIRDHLTQQKARSMMVTTSEMSGNKKSTCAYRGDQETMCAVGCLITDEFYSESMETKPADDSEVLEALVSSLGEDNFFPGKIEVDLLMEWQLYHDGTRNGHSYEDWIWGKPSRCDQSPSEFHKSLFPVAE